MTLKSSQTLLWETSHLGSPGCHVLFLHGRECGAEGPLPHFLQQLFPLRSTFLLMQLHRMKKAAHRLTGESRKGSVLREQWPVTWKGALTQRRVRHSMSRKCSQPAPCSLGALPSLGISYTHASLICCQRPPPLSGLQTMMGKFPYF